MSDLSNYLYYEEPGIRLYCGDCLECLRDLPAESVQCCVTSPPYWGLRDYGVAGQLGLEPTPEEYVAHLVEIFRGVRRVLREDGVLWLNLGDCYARNGGKSGGGNRELMHLEGAQQRMTKIPENGWLLKPKDLIGIPWRVAFALQADGWYLRSDVIWAKPNPMPESVTDRPTKAHEYVFLLSKAERYYYDADAIREESVYGFRSHADAVPMNGRKAKSTAMWRGAGDLTHEVERGPHETGVSYLPEWRRNRRSVWTIATEPYPEVHFATFPRKLVEPCILAGSKPGDVILDPFIGSGTTAFVGKELNRKCVGIDLKSDYLDMAAKRLRQEVLSFGEGA